MTPAVADPVPTANRRPALAYLGTPDMAVPPLRALHQAGFPIRLVVTRIDKRRGRGNEVSPSPVKQAALELGIPVSHRVDDVVELADAGQLELGVVVAFGQIIKPHVLAAVPMVNLHFSLLPRWRGAAPVERALLAGDAETGVGVMAVEEGLDTGGVYAERRVPIQATTTAAELRTTLVDVGTDLLIATLANGLGTPGPQQGEPTYAAKITSDDLVLDGAQTALQRGRVVRVGGAWLQFRGKRLKVLAAEVVDPGAVGDTLHEPPLEGVVGGLRLVTVQPEGKGPMSWRDFANGARPTVGERFGAPVSDSSS